jgi:hypothetical protein
MSFSPSSSSSALTRDSRPVFGPLTDQAARQQSCALLCLALQLSMKQPLVRHAGILSHPSDSLRLSLPQTLNFR